MSAAASKQSQFDSSARRARRDSFALIRGTRNLLGTLAIAALALLALAPAALASKQVTSDFGTASGSGSLGGQFNGPGDIAVNTSGAGPAIGGDVYVADSNNNRIELFHADGSFVSAWGADVVQSGGNGDLGDATAKKYEVCVVASQCKAGVAAAADAGATVAGDGDLSGPGSVTVDQDTGNVYVSDPGNNRVDEYDGEGAFIRSFGFAVDTTTAGTGYEVCPAADACGIGAAGSGVGQIAAGAAGIAVSQPDGNAATGAVFLADAGNRRVNTYKLDGASPSSFGSSANFGSGFPKKIAVDSRGIVYASSSNNAGEVERYDSLNANGGGAVFLAPIPTSLNESQTVHLSGSFGGGFVTGDTFKLGNLPASCSSSTTDPIPFVAENGSTTPANMKAALEAKCGAGSFALGNGPYNDVVTFQGALGGANQPAMTCTPVVVANSVSTCNVTTESDGHPGALLPGATSGLAVDPDSDGAGSDTDVLYVLRDQSVGNTVVQQFGLTSASGHAPGLTAPPTADDDEHGGLAGFNAVNGLGLNDASGRLFVSATDFGFGSALPAGHRIYVLSSPPVPPVAAVDPGSGFANNGTTATFTGTVNPTGFVTGWHFEYSTDDATWTKVPNTDVTLAFTDTSPHAVSQSVSGLLGSQKYFVRLVATKVLGAGAATSAETSFTTSPAVPVISASAVDFNSITPTAVTLDANVNPEGQGTSYQVQYVTQADFDQGGFAGAQSTPAVGIGKGVADVAVSPQVSGLAPGTAYRVRLLATNPTGASYGPDLGFTTYAAPPPPATDCPNQALRTGPGANLPDCRAYEQVSPVDKNGANVRGRLYFNQAAADGHAAVFASQGNLPTSGTAVNHPAYVASRGAGGWSYDGALPAAAAGLGAAERGRDDNLRVSLSVVQGASDAKLVLTDLASFDRQTVLSVPTFNNVDSNPQFADDTAHLIFGDSDALTPDAVTGHNLYDLNHGALSLAGRVPVFPATSCDDSFGPACVGPAAGSFAGSYDTTGGGAGGVIGDLSRGIGYTQNTLSKDGSKVFFTEGGTGRLYMREDGTKTVQVSAPAQGAPADPGGHRPAAWMTSTPSGSKVFFLSCEKSTAVSTAVSTAANTCLTPNQGSDLYSYDTASGELTDLTVDSTGSDAHGAQVQGVLGASADGAYVYFVANGDLDGSGPAVSGNCAAGGSLAPAPAASTSPTAVSPPSSPGSVKAAATTTTNPVPPTPRTGRSSAPAGATPRRPLGSPPAAPSSSPPPAPSPATTTPGRAASPSQPGHPNPGACAELYRYRPGDAGPVCRLLQPDRCTAPLRQRPPQQRSRGWHRRAQPRRHLRRPPPQPLRRRQPRFLRDHRQAPPRRHQR